MRLILVISVSCVWLFTSNYLCTISRHPSTWYESLAQDVAHVHWSTEYSIASGAFNQPMHQTTKYCKAHIYLWCYGHFPRPQNIYFMYEDINYPHMINVKFTTWVLLRVENWCNLCYIYVPWHITEASCRWLHEYPSISLWGHSHTLSSLPVQFRSLMWIGRVLSV